MLCFRSGNARLRILVAALLVGLGGTVCGIRGAELPPEYSQLWGQHGERWDPRGRLPDFSYAGYHRGEKELPRRRADASVADYGAKGDGTTDDTAAFRRAIAACPGKVISIPPGRYVITNILTISQSGTVLQGAGREQSILVCPIPLDAIKPNQGATTTGQPTSEYSWSGGFVEVAGQFPNRRLADVSRAAARGDRSLAVSDLGGLRVGQDFVLRLSDEKSQSLARHLYAEDPGAIEKLENVRESFAFRVTGWDPATKVVEIDRPLRTDVRLEWKPILLAGSSSVEEVGIEEIAFEFPDGAYAGHWKETGFNAIAIKGARNCWVRNLRIHNADSGLFVEGSQVTLTRIQLTSKRSPEPTRQATGHHGMTLNGQDHLLTDFQVETRFMHDITVTRGSAGNVVTRGSGLDLCLDHHRRAPHSNLFCDIELGAGSRMFQSGGGAALGRHSGAYETFWNIRGSQPQSWPRDFAPDRINLIGVTTREPSILDPNGRWLEAIPPERLQPANLYADQLARRLAGEVAPYTPARPTSEVTATKLEWRDIPRDRAVPVKIYSPKEGVGPFPIVIFSHGLGGSRENYEYLGRHWAGCGYVSVHVQHLGSDDSVWRDEPVAERAKAIQRAAANLSNALNRPLDGKFAIDQLEQLNGDTMSPLKGRLNCQAIGMAGHSFGGFTTLALAGQTFVLPLGITKSYGDPRIKAAIQMSAPAPANRRELDQAFRSITIPMMHMTGTHDFVEILPQTKAEDRRIPFDHMSRSETCLVIFKDGDHMIFSGRERLAAAEKLAQDAMFQKLICAGTTAFWDAYLHNNADAKKWLLDGGYAKLLGDQATFEHKVPGAKSTGPK